MLKSITKKNLLLNSIQTIKCRKIHTKLNSINNQHGEMSAYLFIITYPQRFHYNPQFDVNHD